MFFKLILISLLPLTLFSQDTLSFSFSNSLENELTLNQKQEFKVQTYKPKILSKKFTKIVLEEDRYLKINDPDFYIVTNVDMSSSDEGLGRNADNTYME